MANAGRMTYMQMVKYNWKKGWKEIPEILAISIFASAVLANVVYGVITAPPEEHNYRYRHWCEVVRPDDPQLLRVRKYDDTPPITVTPKGFVPTVMEEGRVWTVRR